MGKTVLLVEDYDDARRFMKFLIEEMGYRVVEATNGLEAVLSVESNLPNLILMDISMPVMDGITATRKIRSMKQGGEIPIIAITAHGNEYYDKAIAAGCNKLIQKPVDLDSLRSVLWQYLHD